MQALDSEREETEQQIVDYVRTHQDAGDTAHGIATYWLKGKPVSDVEAVLGKLVKKRIFKLPRQLEGGRMFYKANGDYWDFEKRSRETIRSGGRVIRLIDWLCQNILKRN